MFHVGALAFVRLVVVSVKKEKDVIVGRCFSKVPVWLISGERTWETFC